jgi:type VI secretion system protein ImpA
MAGELDLERLLAPVSPDAPSGSELGYSPAFAILREAAEARLEITQQDGKDLQAPRPRDFKKIRRDALDLLKTGRDLRVLIVLAEALAVTDGPAGFAAGLTLIRRSLQEHWDTLHPSLDLDETKPADQAALRLNALRSLAAQDDMLPELGRLRLLDVPGLGGVSLRDWDLASGRSSPFAYETKPELSAVEIVLKAAAPEAVLASIDALATADAEVAAIDSLLAEQIGDVGALPDLAPLTATIGRMRSLLQQYAPAAAADKGGGQMEASMAPVGSPAEQAGVREATGALPSRLDNREDVLRALDLVVDYYHRREPGSAVPLLIERARRMVPMSFMEAIGDLAPDAVNRLKDLLAPPP